jgi:hypothetical protein
MKFNRGAYNTRNKFNTSGVGFDVVVSSGTAIATPSISGSAFGVVVAPATAILTGSVGSLISTVTVAPATVVLSSVMYYIDIDWHIEIPEVEWSIVNGIQFQLGGVEPDMGGTLTGLTSEATGTIKNIILNSGSWASANAGGYIVLEDIVGDFQDNEILIAPSTATHALRFQNGVHEPVFGEIIRGYPSLATAVIVSMILTSGAWGGTACGYFFVSNITGEFVEGDRIDCFG